MIAQRAGHWRARTFAVCDCLLGWLFLCPNTLAEGAAHHWL